MSVETIISIVGFGLSVGAFLPLLLLKDRRREIAVTALLATVCLFAAWRVYKNHQYDQEVRYVRATVLDELANSDLTYDDMQQRLGDVDSAVLADAIRTMTRGREITANVVRLHSQTGQTFNVRLYLVARIGSPR